MDRHTEEWAGEERVQHLRGRDWQAQEVGVNHCCLQREEDHWEREENHWERLRDSERVHQLC